MRWISTMIAGAALMVGFGVAPAVGQEGGPPGGASPGAVSPDASSQGPVVPTTTERIRDLGHAGLPLAGPVDPATYVVGPGDVLQLQMWGRLSQSLLLSVGPEGYVLVPGAGSINVEGRTLASLRDEVLGRLRGKFTGVSIDLRLARPRNFRIYLTGQVRNPAPMLATGADRVNDVLTPGTLLDDASRRRIEVTHTDGTRELADLDLFLRTGDASLNPWLRDGDIINVPVATEFVFARGALARPDRFELGPRDSLITLFRLAGHPLPSADAGRALLVRWKHPFEAESLWFHVSEVYERTNNPILRDGDHLYVYFIPQYHLQHEATILGEVTRPGVYPIVEGRHRLSDLVSAAGSFLGTADLTTVRVYHSTRVSESDTEFDRLIKLSRAEMTDTEYEVLRAKMAARREDFRVDWFRLQRSPELNILLRGGDVVRVDPLITSVRVEGEVRRPGIVEFEPRRTVGQYVALAGGYSERAARGKVRITRSVTGQSLRSRDVQEVAPGDLIWVPERSDVTIWQRLGTLITVAAQVATLVIAVRR